MRKSTTNTRTSKDISREIVTPPPMEEDQDGLIDEFNDDTFGDDAMAGLQSEFKFGKSEPLPMKPKARLTDLMAFDSAVTVVKRSSSRLLMELEGDDALPPGMQAPPGLSTSFSSNLSTSMSSSIGSKPIMTMEEIEARFRVSTTLNSKYFPIKSKKAAVITFPSNDNPELKDEFAMTITRFEREGISRIHLSQLTTEKPDLEDFYYNAYAKRMTKRRTQETMPLYLPLPIRKRIERHSNNSNEKEKERTAAVAKTKEALSMALGKAATSSSRKPRQQLEVPSVAQIFSKRGSDAIQYSVASCVETLYDSLFLVEDALHLDSDTDYDLHVLHERRKNALSLFRKELSLCDDFTCDEKKLLRFLNFLAMAKGKKLMGRAIKSIDSEVFSYEILSKIIEYFEYLDICRHDADAVNIDLFVNSILAALVPYVVKMPYLQVFEQLSVLNSKESSLPWIASNKAGLVLLCILLSRLEIVKPSVSESELYAWQTEVAPRIFTQLQDRLPELVPVNNDFYGWQFMALLALNVDADCKRAMVLELRERILAIATSADTERITNLNIFLNAIGLDASQLGGN